MANKSNALTPGRSLILAVASLCALALPSGARADIYVTQTFFGTLTSGTDSQNFFGGTDFAAANTGVTIALSIDSTAFQTANINGLGSFGNIRGSYLAFNDQAGDNAESITVTINGISYGVTSSASGVYGANQSPSTVNFSSQDSAGHRIAFTVAGSTPIGVYNGPVAAEIQLAPTVFNSLTGITSFSVNRETLGISAASTSAPEPSTLGLATLAIAGFVTVARRSKLKIQS